MKVLFVSSGNVESGISPITKSQGDSLSSLGIQVEYFLIKGKGFWKYFRYIFTLKKHLKRNKYDIIHAHYSFCGYLVGLTLDKTKKVVSLMGSDTNKKGLELVLINIFYRFFWDITIVKSERMKEHFGNKRMRVIPNGVNFDYYKPLSKETCQDNVGFKRGIKHIIFFLSHSHRTEKNLPLAKEAIAQLNREDVEFHIINFVEKERVPILLNASDVLLLTSFFEGSPNIIKEAMACNIPIVTTDVGDVRTTIGNTEGCFITSFDPFEIKESIEKVLNYGKRTEGRDNIKFLDSKLIAGKLVKIYSELKDEK